jgi:hypothetical protein
MMTQKLPSIFLFVVEAHSMIGKTNQTQSQTFFVTERSKSTTTRSRMCTFLSKLTPRLTSDTTSNRQHHFQEVFQFSTLTIARSHTLFRWRAALMARMPSKTVRDLSIRNLMSGETMPLSKNNTPRLATTLLTLLRNRARKT